MHGEVTQSREPETGLYSAVSELRQSQREEKLAIKRIWHGWTTRENAEAYRLILEQKVRPGVAEKKIPGYRSLELLSRDLGSEVAKAVLSRWDEVCAHYEITENYGQP